MKKKRDRKDRGKLADGKRNAAQQSKISITKTKRDLPTDNLGTWGGDACRETYS